MRFKAAVLALFIALAASPARADDGSSVRFNNFGFRLDPTLGGNVNIVQAPGDPVDVQAPGGAEVKHTEFVMYSDPNNIPSSFEASAAIRIYNTADLAPYQENQRRFEQLKTLLDNTADLAPYMKASAT